MFDSIYFIVTYISSSFHHVSSPSTLVAGVSDDSGIFGTAVASPVSPGFNSAKRVLPEEDNTASKRLRLEYPTSVPPERPAVVPVQPRPTVGLASRVDHAAVQQAAMRFALEVRQPIIAAMDQIRGKCVICLVLGKVNWDTHHHDDCPGDEMDYGRDEYFVQFKNAMKLPKYFCYGCGLQGVRSIYFILFHFFF